MKAGITRAAFLRGGVAALATASGAPLAALVRPASPSLLDLDFRPVHRFRPFDLLPAKFGEVHRDLRGRFEVLSQGAPAWVEEL